MDRSRPEAVFDAAMAAVSESDLDALWPLLTDSARIDVEQQLKALQASLRDPERLQLVLHTVEERGRTFEPALLERARTGTVKDVWAFFLTVDPRSATPDREPVGEPTGRFHRMEYRDPDGNLRPIRFVHLADGWYIDDLSL